MLNLVWWILGGRLVSALTAVAVFWAVSSVLTYDWIYDYYHSKCASCAVLLIANDLLERVENVWIHWAVRILAATIEFVCWPIEAVLIPIAACWYVKKYELF